MTSKDAHDFTRQDVLRARAALSATPSGWRGIESAPKDGTRIDLWVAGRRITDSRWARNDADSTVPFGEPRWQGFYGLQEPTHWMPLPDAPVVTKEPK